MMVLLAAPIAMIWNLTMITFSLFSYFRHAGSALIILSKNLAQYVNINRLVVNAFTGKTRCGFNQKFVFLFWDLLSIEAYKLPDGQPNWFVHDFIDCKLPYFCNEGFLVSPSDKNNWYISVKPWEPVSCLKIYDKLNCTRPWSSVVLLIILAPFLSFHCIKLKWLN